MKVIVKAPYERIGHLAEISSSLEDMQKIVDGWIEPVYVDDRFIIVCNEEGKLRQMDVNFRIPHDIICGTVFVCGDGEEDFEDVPIGLEEWAKCLQKWGNA